MVMSADAPTPTGPVIPGLGGMVAGPDALPDVLPTDRLGPRAKPRPPWRDDLRRIPNARNALSVVWLVTMTVGVLWLAAWVANPVGYALAFVAEGCLIVRFNILGHEAVHRLLFSDKRLNDWVGRWVAKMRSATGRLCGLRRPRNRPFRIFQPEIPTASRTSLRRIESREIG